MAPLPMSAHAARPWPWKTSTCAARLVKLSAARGVMQPRVMGKTVLGSPALDRKLSRARQERNKRETILATRMGRKTRLLPRCGDSK